MRYDVYIYIHIYIVRRQRVNVLATNGTSEADKSTFSTTYHLPKTFRNFHDRALSTNGSYSEDNFELRP